MKTKFTLTVFLLFFLTLFCSYVAFAQTVNVTNHGATVNNPSNDDTVGIRAAIEACQGLSNPVLYFPKGIYHLDSEAGTGNYFFINGIDNLTIDGAGSTIIITGGAHRRTNARNTFQFWNCNNLKIKNLNTDFENPPFSQTRVVASGSGYLNLQLQSGFSMTQDNGTNKDIRNYTAYDPDLGQQVNEEHSWNNGITWSWVNRNQNIIRMNDNQFNYPVGTYVYLRHAQYDGYTYFFSRGCKDVVLENINVYKASGYPFYANEGAENLSFINCGIRKSSPSFWATATADGAHLLDARGQIVFDGCHFEGQNDDGINLHSYYVDIVQSVNQRTIRVDNTEGFHSLRGWRVGDTVEFFLKSTVQSIGTRVITNITNISNGASQMTLEFNENLPNFPGGINAVKASNITCIGSLTVKNSTFKGNRSRGILVSTNNVLIENCTFNRTLTNAILMEISASWYESTPTRNLTIRNNVFDEVVYGRTSRNLGAITFGIIGFTMGDECDIFKNVSITGNTFRKTNSSAIVARRVSGLEIRDNVIENPGTNGGLIRYGNSKNITIANNTGATIDNMGSNCPNDAVVSVTGVTITPDTASIAPTQTVQLSPVILPANASNKSVTWTSSNTAIATVSSNGLVTAVALGGPVTITATTADGSFKDTAIIIVNGEVVPEGTISVNGPDTVVRGQIVTVEVSYNATTARDIIIFLQEHNVDLNGDNDRYTVIGEARITVAAGQNTLSAEITVSSSAPLSGSYRYSAFLTTVGGQWGQKIGSESTKPEITVTTQLNTPDVVNQIFSVYPNPADDYLQVSIPDAGISNVQFKLYDMLGKLVYQEKVDSSKGKWQIDVNNLSKGIHVLEITADNQVMYHKVVKK